MLDVLLTTAAGRSEQENTTNRALLDLLQEELVGLIRARHNNLLKEVLK